MDYNALGLANDISDNHKQSYFNVKDQEVLFSFFGYYFAASYLNINNPIIIIIFVSKLPKFCTFQQSLCKHCIGGS